MARLNLPVARLITTLTLVSCCSIAFAQAKIDNLAPPLQVKELDGHIFNLAAQRGKVVLVNFWATWCPPCRTEIPVLNSFYRRYHARGVEIIGLSVNSKHDRDAVAKVAHSFSYPAAMIVNAKVNGFGFPVVVPITYIVDASGTLRAILRPGRTRIDSKSLIRTVLPLLNKREH